MKHTPGPWHVGREWEADQLRPHIDILRDVTYVEGVKPTTYLIADVRYPTTTGNTIGAEERAANARLIAASPDLLEALSELHEAESAPYPPAEAGQDAQTAWSTRKAAAHENARAAISKATGGAS